MNLDYQDPFRTSCPRIIERRITDLFCRSAVFSKSGRFLASACSDNSVILFDTSTYTRVSELFDASLNDSAIQTISFNCKSDLIVTLFESGNLVIWNPLTKTIVNRIFSNGEDRICFAKYHLESDNLIIIRESGSIAGVNGTSFLKTKGSIVHAEISKKYLFIIDTQGILSINDVYSGKPLKTISESEMQISENSSCSTYISCHFESNLLSIVSKNRIIRVVNYDSASNNVSIKFKLLDAVNKWPWRHSGFSHHIEVDSLLTFGTAVSKGKHLIYLWDNLTGSLVHTLEGPKEEIGHVVWHPKKPQLLTVGAQSGQIFVWGPGFPQKWAALVPNIEAIETNIEYIEREDEFDLSIDEEIKLDRDRDESTQIDFSDFIKAKEDIYRDDLFIFYPLNCL